MIWFILCSILEPLWRQQSWSVLCQQHFYPHNIKKQHLYRHQIYYSITSSTKIQQAMEILELPQDILWDGDQSPMTLSPDHYSDASAEQILIFEDSFATGKKTSPFLSPGCGVNQHLQRKNV